jgi:aryl-alcohol dehydrogenase-like predicted oxidoreductase
MAKTVGVANYDKDDMVKMADALEEYGIPLATNQCEYHVLRRLPETSGLLEECKQRGIIFQSYSSLAQGRLSGKYTAENPPPKEYRFSSYPMEEIEPTLRVLKEIASARGKPMSAVALNYNLSKGVCPVVGFRKRSQVEDNLQALGWRLTGGEVKRLDDCSLEGKSTKLWQQG